MARTTVTVCDSCNENPAGNFIRLTQGARSDTGDLCDICLERIRAEVPGLRTGQKRGRKAK